MVNLFNLLISRLISVGTNIVFQDDSLRNTFCGLRFDNEIWMPPTTDSICGKFFKTSIPCAKPYEDPILNPSQKRELSPIQGRLFNLKIKNRPKKLTTMISFQKFTAVISPQ